MPTSLITENTLLVLVGLIVLAVNIAIALIQLRNGRSRANFLNIGLSLAACAIIAFGLVRSVFATGPESQPLPLILAAAGGVVAIVVSLLLYQNELRKEGAESGISMGLLNVGAGTFILVAALVIPLIPSQIASTPVAALPVSAANSPKQQLAATATPTLTPSPSNTPFNTPTPLPSLTPTPSETPIVLYTPIVYVSTYAMTMTTNCTVIANTMAYLRGDPSEKMSSIGTIFAGSLLNVTGRSTDKKWWQVINNDGIAPVEGWVRADYVTADSTCTDEAVPVIGPTTATPTQARAQLNPTSAVTAGPCTLLTTTSASLRPDASLRQASLAQIPAGTALSATGRSANGWWQVSYNGQAGWVGGGAVVAAASCNSLPIITPTPKPS